MSTERLITIAIGIQFICVAIVLTYLDAVFRWIAHNGWLWKDKLPWIPHVLGYSTLVFSIVGVILFFFCLEWGTTRQRITSFFLALFLFSYGVAELEWHHEKNVHLKRAVAFDSLFGCRLPLETPLSFRL
jgi:amino acid transporter